MKVFFILLIPVIFVIAVIRGIKQGFIKQIISLVSTVVAVILALYISAPVSVSVYDGFLEDRVCNRISTAIEEKAGSDALTEKIVESLPSYVKRIVSEKKITETVNDTVVIDGSRADSIARNINDKLAKPFITKLVRVIAFLIIFIIVKLLLFVLANALNIIAKLPVINGANKLLGGVIGAVKGALFSGLIIYALYIFDKL